MKRLFLLSLLYLATPFALLAAQEPQVWAASVRRVIDGDTIVVQIIKARAIPPHPTLSPQWGRGDVLRVRLAEIDCPEMAQPFGPQAKDFVERLVLHQVVTLHIAGQDRYGRIIADVRFGSGHSLNEALVLLGFAWWYEKYSDNEDLGRLQTEAQRAARGLWTADNPVAPWDWRRKR